MSEIHGDSPCVCAMVHKSAPRGSGSDLRSPDHELVNVNPIHAKTDVAGTATHSTPSDAVSICANRVAVWCELTTR